MRGILGPLVYAILRALDRVLQLLVRPRADRVCFLSIPDHADNAFHTYRHLVVARSGLELVWLVGDLGLVERIEAEFARLTRDRPDHGHRVRVVARRSVRGYLTYLTCRYVFHSQGAYAFSRWGHRRHVVNLWHGMPIKAIGRLNRRTPSIKEAFGTVQVATSHAWRYLIATAFAADPADVLVTSLPRCDALQFVDARSTTREVVRAALDVPSDHRLVLWMPTWRVQDGRAFVHRGLDAISERRALAAGPRARSFLDDLPAWALPALEDACADHGCTLVIKLHPLDSLAGTQQGLDLPDARWLTSPTLADHEIHLYDLLAASDGLLSDLSSVVIDYLVTGRPIGLIGFVEEAYDRDLLFPVSLFRDSARFDDLSDPETVDAFFADVAAGKLLDPRTDELTRVLYETVGTRGAEQVVSHVGL